MIERCREFNDSTKCVITNIDVSTVACIIDNYMTEGLATDVETYCVTLPADHDLHTLYVRRHVYQCLKLNN